jgi:signal transduction histidine kinase/CheY-like chemotaxis protein
MTTSSLWQVVSRFERKCRGLAVLLFSLTSWTSALASALPLIELGSSPQETMLRPRLLMVVEDGAKDESFPTWGPQQAMDRALQGKTIPIVVEGAPYRSDQAHWALTQLVHESAETDWVLYYRLATLERVQAFARVKDGAWLPLKGLHFQAQAFHGYHYPSFALSLPKGQVVELAVRVQTRAPIRMPIVAVPGYHFYESQRGDLILAGMTLAVPAVVLLYLALLLPRTVSLGLSWFIALIVLETIGALWISGHGHVILPMVSREVWPIIGRLAYMAMIAVGWIHLHRFIGSVFIPRWANWAGWLTVSLMAVSVLLELTQWVNTRNAFTYGVLVFPSLVVILALSAWRKGVAFAGLYALAWSAFVLSAALSFAGLVGWTSVSGWQIYSVQSSVAALLFGLIAVGHVRARDAALLEATQERSRLAEEKIRLQEALKARLEFFAATNHDLRQPLQAMNIHLELAEKAAADDPRASKVLSFLDDARSAYSSVSHFLESLMDLVRVEAKILRPRTETIALRVLLEQLTREYRPLAGRAGLEFRSWLGDGYVLVDSRFLARVLRNLLGNAIRYAERGGVMLCMRRRGSFWRVDVIDTGPGFSSRQLETLYQAFSRGGTSAQTEQRGKPQSTGLGLFIVRQMCDAMGVRLELASRIGRGSRFSVYLPAASADEIGDARDLSAFTSDFQGRLVGLLDDDQEVSKALHTLLMSWGAEVVSARSLDQFFNLLSQGIVLDVLIADHRLGFDERLTDHLQSLQARCQCPIIALTGDSDMQVLQELNNAGIDHVLVKPVDLRDLQAALRITLGAPAEGKAMPA